MRVIGDKMNLKIKKLTFIVFLTLSMIQNVYSLGLTEPTFGISLLRGDSAEFNFQIQAVTSSDDQSCSYSIDGMDPLVISFEENEVLVKAGEKKNIYGTVSVPEDAEIKKYKGDLTVRCKPQIGDDVSGSVIHRTMISEFSVNVVETLEEREVPSIPKKEMPSSLYNLPIIIIIIVIIILVIGIYYWTERKKK